MSLPQSSQELAEWIFQSQAPGPEIKWGHCWCCDATLTRVTALIETYVAEAVFKEAEWWAMALVRENLHPTDMAEANARLKRMQPAGEANDRS